MGKRVHVDSYSKTDGTHVRAYTRHDPRAKSYKSTGELPPEDQKPSFLSEGIEEESEGDNQEETEGSERKFSKSGSTKKGSFDESD
jgi:hypothetical protein